LALGRIGQTACGVSCTGGLRSAPTLSKVANALAKATEKVWGGVVDLHEVKLRRRLLEHWPVGEIGGA
tara:strand:+ start:7089 stop:7292 length:204 start_codon:yes stop_codon:yes gene_type:complete